MNKIFRGLTRRHAGINKADQVGKRVVAKDHVHGRCAMLPAINTVELSGASSIERYTVAAMKRNANRPAKDTFIRRHPVQAQLVRDFKRLVRHAALRWPHASRAHAENLLMQLQAALNLLTRILRMVEALRR